MKKGIFTLFLLILSTSLSYAQNSTRATSWNYPTHPDLPFKLEHLQLDLEVDPEIPMIKGTGTFELTSRHPDLISVVFNTSDLEVGSVSAEGEELEFRVSSDSLIIHLADTAGVGQKIRFVIAWESSSPYGIHTDIYGNLWTSLNPNSRHHWLPIPDHPEVASTFEASVTIPADKKLIFNGAKQDDEVVSAQEKTVKWASEVPVPVSGLTLVLGDLAKESAISGVKEVSVYASEKVLLPEVRSGLLSIAVSTLKEMEGSLSFEFPYEDLSIVVLPDHKWEEIQSGAGIIYVYENLGSLATQVKRGIAEQWFGNYHRYLNAPDNKYEFLKAMLAGTSETDLLLNPDELQSIHKWNIWEKRFDKLEDPFLKNTIESSLPELMKHFEGVTGWTDYASYWYDQTGAYWEDLPRVMNENDQPDSEFVYRVHYQYDEMKPSLKLIFEALSTPLETLAGVEATAYGFTDTTRSTISFTGQTDTISVKISSSIEYLTLSPSSNKNIVLKEHKPFMFLIRQLRSTETANRKKAAVLLRSYTDNPDIQLAIRDVLKVEEDPEVKAALLETLAMIIKGATGTEQTFIEVLNSEDQAIRLAGLRALSNYPDNESVSYSIRNALLKATSDTVFTTALSTYRKTASNDDLISLALRFEKADQSDEKAIRVMNVAVQEDTTHQTISIADRYALGQFPYEIRKQALELLIQYEDNASYWAQTLELLLVDRDPRIRYHALDAVKYLSPKRTVELVVERAKEELDPRVLEKVEGIMKRTKK